MPPSNITGVNLLGQISQQAYQAQLHNAQASHQALLGQLARHAYPENVTPIRKERTPEEIQEQLEARLAELEQEAQRPERLYPCASCRWAEKGTRRPYCYQPLITGLEGKSARRWAYDALQADYNVLCGPEKALWEPKRTWWQRILDRIIQSIQEG